MKKLLGLLSVGIISLGLAGCGNTSNHSTVSSSSETAKTDISKSKLETYYHRTTNDLTLIINDLNEKLENSTTDSSAVAKDSKNTQNDIVHDNAKLKKSSSYTSQLLIKYNNTVYTMASSLANGDSSNFQDDWNDIAKAEREAVDNLGLDSPARLEAAINKLDKTIQANQNSQNTKSVSNSEDSNGADTTFITGRTIKTADFTINIDRVDFTTDEENHNLAVIYYTYKNLSNKLSDNPMVYFGEVASVTQENDSSVKELDTSNNPSESYYEQHSDYETEYDNSLSNVKPQQQIQCAETFTLISDSYPIKINVRDVNNTDHIGTITLQLNQ